MATFTLVLSGFHLVADSFGWAMVGVPTTEISELVEIGENLIKNGAADGGHILLDTTGEVVVKWANGKKWVAE